MLYQHHTFQALVLNNHQAYQGSEGTVGESNSSTCSQIFGSPRSVGYLWSSGRKPELELIHPSFSSISTTGKGIPRHLPIGFLPSEAVWKLQHLNHNFDTGSTPIGLLEVEIRARTDLNFHPSPQLEPRVAPYLNNYQANPFRSKATRELSTRRQTLVLEPLQSELWKLSYNRERDLNSTIRPNQKLRLTASDISLEPSNLFQI